MYSKAKITSCTLGKLVAYLYGVHEQLLDLIYA